uniref:Rho-GAP domain-containing protein n=1 Tax=Ciona savignyi TaxID=51511 RepID=H2ZKP1_CIOSA
MDAVIENVRNSFEVGVRKVLSGQISNKKNTVTLQNYKNKSESKIFGISLSDLCGREGGEVPNIIRDICTFIQTNYLHIEGIFRISAPSAQTTKLKEAFEQNCDLQVTEVCLLSNVDGHTAANVLKQFLRQLPHPLVPEQVLKISRDSRCVSDETFAESVKSSMTTWEPVNRCTLQYLLMFLQQVMQNSDNRMTVTGLGVVFGPNVFKISSGISEQETANKTFERLLMTCDIICGKNIDDQGYLKMASPTSIKPVRPAPPVPPQGRPLPPPPVPPHGPHPNPNAGLDHLDNGLHNNNNEILHQEDLNNGSNLQGNDSPPLVLPRVHSLNRSYGSCDGDSDFMSTSEDYTIDDLHDQPAEEDTAKLVDRTVRHVVRKHLFNHESSSSSCADDAYSAFPNNDNADPELLPSLTAGRIGGPANRRKPTRKHHAENGHLNSEESKLHENIEHVYPIPMQRKKIEVTNETVTISNDPIVSTSSTAVVTTPDSGCLTAEEDYPRRTHIITEVFIPKLNLQEAFEEANSETTDVPRLDLSEVTQLDELTKPKPIPRQHKSNAKKKKKKGNKSSPNANTNHYKMSSEPIKIPEPNKHILDDELSSDFSPKDTSSSRWRDAWSTDDETGSPVAVLDNDIHSRYAQQVSDNMEVAPSSPSENHVYPRTHHMHHNHGHHHSHSHHHHHNNPNQKQSHTQSYLSRPKLNKNLQADENIETMQNNLAEIILKLEESRKECGT